MPTTSGTFIYKYADDTNSEYFAKVLTVTNGEITVKNSLIDLYVSAGSFSDPYYNFYSDSQGNSEVTAISLSSSYRFSRLNSATSHPFYVSDQGYKNNSSNDITLIGEGSSSNGISGNEKFILIFNTFSQNDNLTYYCSLHSSMQKAFQFE